MNASWVATLQMIQARVQHVCGMYNEYQLPTMWRIFKGGIHSRKYGNSNDLVKL